MKVLTPMNRVFSAWLNRRIPESANITLSQRKIFILPTRQGFFYLLVIALILLLAINFQNSLVFALVFFLFSIFIIAILHCYRNLSGLQLRAGKSQNAVADTFVSFQIHLSRQQRRQHHSVYLCWPPNQGEWISLDNQHSDMTIEIPIHVIKRGRFKPGRLLVESLYPLGLLRAWTWLDLGVSALVYPKPIEAQAMHFESQGDESEANAVTSKAGVDDFDALRSYQAGDSLKHIAWKNVAKGQALQTKLFSAAQSGTEVLDWQAYAYLGTEKCLSALSYAIFELESQGKPYGLKMPGHDFEPASGQQHQQTLLSALALYGSPEYGSSESQGDPQ